MAAGERPLNAEVSRAAGRSLVPRRGTGASPKGLLDGHCGCDQCQLRPTDSVAIRRHQPSDRCRVPGGGGAADGEAEHPGKAGELRAGRRHLGETKEARHFPSSRSQGKSMRNGRNGVPQGSCIEALPSSVTTLGNRATEDALCRGHCAAHSACLSCDCRRPDVTRTSTASPEDSDLLTLAQGTAHRPKAG